MHWVLIIIITVGGKPAVATAEFSDEMLCKTAATAVQIKANDLFSFSTRISAECYATGDGP